MKGYQKFHAHSDGTLLLLEEQAKEDMSDYRVLDSDIYVAYPSSEFLQLAIDNGVEFAS